MKNSSVLKRIAIKAGTTDGDLYKKVVESASEVKELTVDPCLSVYVLSDGTAIEVYSTGACYPGYLFMHGNIVVSFKVDDLETTVNALRSEGAVLLGNVEPVSSSYSYCHMLTREETVIGLYQYR